jgi:hypothetical protein
MLIAHGTHYPVAFQFTIKTSASDLSILSPDNVGRAWIATKKLHPLLGARIQDRPDQSGADFIIEEARLNSVGLNDIIYTSAVSEEDALGIADKSMNGPPILSNDLLAQMWIISLPQDPSGSATHHLVVHMRHSIGDAMAAYSMMKRFLDILVHPMTPEKYTPKESLEDCLALHPAADDLNSSRHSSVAKQRWRRSIAKVMYARRTASFTVRFTETTFERFA